ncbi:unnamed protein product [Discosporangium mesarthrocarpum]
MVSMRREVLGGFKRLMRARLEVFREDTQAVDAARETLRAEFMKNSGETDPSKIAVLIKGIAEVESMLKFNVVQGKKNERGNFAVKLSSVQEGGMGAHTEISHVDSNAGDLPASVEKTAVPGKDS